jgi:putative phosphoesterase
MTKTISGYMTAPDSIKIGLISDTHDLLRPEAIETLQGCDHIVHAGDIGGAKILRELKKIAPVTAVRGNTDGGWAMKLPESVELTLEGLRFFVIHSASWADVDFDTAGYDVVVEGHTHHPILNEENGTLFVNPGSAGPVRLGKPIAVGLLYINGKNIRPEIIELPDTPNDS